MVFGLFFFLDKISQNKLFWKLVARKQAILDDININLRKFKILHFSKGVSPWFLAKNRKLCPFLFCSKRGQKKVFCGVQDRKLAILEYKNIHFEKSHFSEGVSPWFWVKY